MKNYFFAASLGNGNMRLFADSARELRWPAIIVHFFLITAMLYLPLMNAVAPLSPYEMFMRINPEYLSSLDPDTFNSGMHDGGYGPRILLPVLAGMYLLLFIIQAVFYSCAALFMKVNRLSSTTFNFRQCAGIFVMSSTVPVIFAAILGFFLPTVHIIVFYLAEIVLGFYISKKYDESERQESKLWEYPA